MLVLRGRYSDHGDPEFVRGEAPKRLSASAGELGHDLASESFDLRGAGVGPAADEIAVAGVAPFARVLARGVDVVERDRARSHDRGRITSCLGRKLVDALVRLA